MMTYQERREKVINGLMCCHSGERDCSRCPYVEYGICHVQLRDDAIYLLQAQEQMDVQNENSGYGDCPKCGALLEIWHDENFCGKCGQAVKWK